LYAKSKYLGDDGVGYILLALQPVYPTSGKGCGGWNPVGGWHDDTDKDLQHTAAREAFEESLGAVGTINFVRELLLDKNACAQIFPGCFLAGYGESLSTDDRKWVVRHHKKKKIKYFK